MILKLCTFMLVVFLVACNAESKNDTERQEIEAKRAERSAKWESWKVAIKTGKSQDAQIANAISEIDNEIIVARIIEAYGLFLSAHRLLLFLMLF